jgi:hypothetical protein
VLELCAEAGLVEVGIVAVDGTKIAAAASGDRRTALREARQALEAKRAERPNRVPRDRPGRLVECRRRLRQDWQLERHVITEHAAWSRRGLPATGRGA